MAGAVDSFDVDVPRRSSEARNWIATTAGIAESGRSGTPAALPASCCADAGFAGTPVLTGRSTPIQRTRPSPTASTQEAAIAIVRIRSRERLDAPDSLAGAVTINR